MIAEETAEPVPAVTVAVIPEYGVGSEASNAHVREVLKALAQQDFGESVEHLLIGGDTGAESTESILPSLRVIDGRSGNSYVLKNEAMAAARSELVAILDGDCQPDPDWLRLAVQALRDDSRAAAVSGRTEYPRDTFLGRAMGLLERSYIEASGAGRTDHIANNGAAFRRSIYMRHPLPTDRGIFASREQSEAMLRDGHRLLFEPRMRVVHAFDDAFDRDHRAGIGYGAISIRRRNPALPGAWAARLGYLSIPVFLGVRFAKSCWCAMRFHARYGIRRLDLPAVFLLALRGGLREIPGMWRAVRDQPPPPTAFS